MEKFYDYYSRFNAFYNMYVDIAVTHYIEAKLTYDYFYKDEAQFIGNNDYIYQEIAISETFAAFAIESFLNDYAAVCFGDDFFMDTFDRIGALAKLKLISGIMFHKRLDNNDDICNHINYTFSRRIVHAHNKSFSDEKYNELLRKESKKNKILCTQSGLDDFNDELERNFLYFKSEVNKALNDARIPLFALADLAYYVDENDDDSNAKIKIFGYKANLGNADNLQPKQFIEKLINELYELNKSYGMLEHIGKKINIDNEAFIKTWPEK